VDTELGAASGSAVDENPFFVWEEVLSVGGGRVGGVEGCGEVFADEVSFADPGALCFWEADGDGGGGWMGAEGVNEAGDVRRGGAGRTVVVDEEDVHVVFREDD